MTTLTATDAWLADRAEIHDLLARYAWAIDTWDAAGAAACFTASGRLSAGDGSVLADGAQALRAFFSRGRRGGRLGTMGEGELISVSHTIGSILVEPVADAAARARCGCTATTLARHGERTALHLHGIRYDDVVVRTPEGWRIEQRTHYVDWARELLTSD